MDDALYFNWLVEQISFPGINEYSSVLTALDHVPFFYMSGITLDKDRVADAYEMRGEVLGQDIPRLPSVLEVMVALVKRCETTFMHDPDSGDRCGLWFVKMLVSMGLYDLKDKFFDIQQFNDKLTTTLERRYAANGAGGMFTLREPKEDMRGVDIWTQALWWFNEYFTDITISEEYYERNT